MAEDVIKNAALKGGMQGGMGKAKAAPAKAAPKEPVEEIPSDIKDKLQTMKNERAAAAYEKRRAAGEDYKKGGMLKMAKGGSASSRADGCAQRGKTRGKMV
jgi:hypothetical protein